MKKYMVAILALSVIVGISGNLLAQDKDAKKNPVTLIVTQFLKQIEKAELTADQTTKAKELMTKAAEDVSAKRTAGGISADILKKRTDAFKSAKESGKKGKEMQAAVEASLGLTEEQLKVYKETETILTKAKLEIGKLLSPEQIAKLPEQAQAAFKAKEGGKKAKAK